MTWGELQIEVQRLYGLHRTSIHPDMAEKLKNTIKKELPITRDCYSKKNQTVNDIINNVTEKGE
jgi:hypothetical protein